MTDHTPAEYIVEEMAARDWSRERVAEMPAWSHAALDALLVQQEPFTDQQAADLTRCFGSSGPFWVNLETAYRRWLHARNHHRCGEGS